MRCGLCEGGNTYDFHSALATRHFRKLVWHVQIRGGGGTQQSFILGGSAPRSKPLPFYIPFLREKVPLSYTAEGLLLNFSPKKPLKILV